MAGPAATSSPSRVLSRRAAVVAQPGSRDRAEVVESPRVDVETSVQEREPRWVRAAWWVLLGGTAVLYLWDLGASGWANSFYAAAAQAGSESWKAFFFGSLDAGNAITVDKPPASLWVMGLSVRIFGLSSWAILVPQALMGVAAVGLLHATVRRSTGSAAAGLLAGLVLALTPVAVLMFRYNNPDALLTLLLIGAAAATLRAVEATRARAEGTTAHPVAWLALGGALVGAAFLTKMLQAFLVLPALVAVYLIAAHTPLGKRLGHLLVAFATMIATAGWWIAIVTLWPATDRPYIGGSTTNSILQLTLGYNGVSRFATSTGTSDLGMLRLFETGVGGQVAWLLLAALVLLVVGLWFTSQPHRGAAHAGLVLWGTWLVVTLLTFSVMAGIFHAYYTVMLAPAIAAVVAIGAHALWQHRAGLSAALTLAACVALTTAVGFVILRRAPEFAPPLRWLVLVAGVVAAGLLVAFRERRADRAVRLVLALSVVAGLLGPVAFALDTVLTPHSGPVPLAGPVTGGPDSWSVLESRLAYESASPAVVSVLDQGSRDYTWAAATLGSSTAASYQLSTRLPMLALGGYNGTDPAPTLAQFRSTVAAHQVHYLITDVVRQDRGRLGPAGDRTAIVRWVRQHFRPRTVDGVRLYDLSGGAR